MSYTLEEIKEHIKNAEKVEVITDSSYYSNLAVAKALVLLLEQKELLGAKSQEDTE